MKNRIAALSMTLALAVGLCAPAHAAESQTVQALQNADITVTMDGTPQTFHDAVGNVVLPLTYGGTTYLPLRAVSGLVGLGVEWDGSTQTAKLTTPETPAPTTSPADGTGDGLTSQTVPALLNGALTVTLDGEAQTFHDAGGAVVLPITYNGTTYLPVRAVCGLVGLPVEWVQETNTVKLGKTSAEIPAGAVAITEMNQLDGDKCGAEAYTDGFHLNPNRVSYGGSNIGLTTKGYRTLTMTFKAADKDTRFTPSIRLLGDGMWDSTVDREILVVKAGETKTLTFDCSGSESTYIRIEQDANRGNFAEGWITNMYLLP